MSNEALSDFTPRAQKVLALAREEAAQFNHEFVGTEHLLFGFIKIGEGVAVSILRKLGLDLETVRVELEQLVGPGPSYPKMIGNRPYTPRVKKVLAYAANEARALGYASVGTEHMLVGILREGDGVAARVLRNRGVDIEKVRRQIPRPSDPSTSPE